MNNAQGYATVPLRKFGGLFTDSGASSIPEGASPRTWDTDFLVAGVKMRPTLQSAFSFTGESTGPNGPGAASDQNLNGAPWSNPGNILVSGSGYATCTPSGSSSAGPAIATSGVSHGGGVLPWSNPSAVTGNSSFATVTVPAGSFSDALWATAFFASNPIPANAVINGIGVSFNGSNSPANSAYTLRVQILYLGTLFGNYKPVILGSTSSPYTLGGSGDTWHIPPSLFNNSVIGFGVSFIADGFGSGPSNISINDVNITFYYTLPANSDLLIAEQFGFSIPAQPINGLVVGVQGYQTGSGTLSVQILKAGVPVGVAKTLSLPASDAFTNLGSATDMWGTTLAYSDINATNFGVAISYTGPGTPEAFIDYVQITVYQTSGSQNFLWMKTYHDMVGGIYTLAIDNQGVLWREDVVNNPGVLSSVYTGILPNTYAKSVTVNDDEYICLSNLQNGTDIPRQYNNQWLDRISQVGPGAGPSISATTQTYAVTSITQVAQKTLGDGTGNYYVLWSAGPTLTTPGNVLTFYGPIGSTWVGAGPTGQLALGDQIVLSSVQTMNGFNPNNGGGNPAAYTVIQIGTAKGSGGMHPIFSVQVLETGFYDQTVTNGAKYQPTLATLTAAEPIPNLQVGGQITETGATPAGWNGTWTILFSANAAQLQINNTSLTSNVATYSYTLISGSTPSTGQLVTVFGTNNGNGIFNIVNGVITGTGAGTFTVAITSPNISSAAEDGNAIVSGTIFQFDPGIIIGNTSVGGSVVAAGNIGAGLRNCVVMFLTRNGFLTGCSVPVTAYLTGGTTQLQVTNIPIGPANVVARWIAFTGANGGNYFVIPVPVKVLSQSQSVIYSSTVVNDNVSTQATFIFTDAILLAALAIDVQGQNQFEVGEVGSCLGNIVYANRMFYWGVQNKVPNFVNWSFDGGIGRIVPPPGDSGTTIQTYPLGWTVDPVNGAGGTVVVSPVFGNSYSIINSSGSTQSIYGMITQPAFQDAYQVNIINPQVAYSVRVTARCPSGSASGNLVVDLYSPGIGRQFGQFVVGLSSMSTVMQIFTGTILTSVFSNVPNDLVLRVYSTSIPNGGDIEIDRLEVFPTTQPVLLPNVWGSYVSAFEAVDQVTGNIDTSSINEQPVRAAFNLYDTLYFVKARSIVSTQDNGVTEPSQWNIRTVSNSVGTLSINGVDYTSLQTGEAYVVIAGRPGVYIFSGGEPIPIHREIQQIWNAINWNAESSLWVRNDIVNQRLYIGIPLPTPNEWLPNAPVNASPTTPNVILMCNYKELNTGGEIASRPGVHDSAFTGHLLSLDIVRKWSLWQITSPYADFILRSTSQTPLALGNSQGNGKVYTLQEGGGSDDGAAVNELYTTYAFIDSMTAEQIGLGSLRHLYAYMVARLSGSGNLSVTTLPNSVDSTEANTLLPVVLTSPEQEDMELPLNETASRLYLQFSTNAAGAQFSLSGIQVVVGNDPWSQVTGSGF